MTTSFPPLKIGALALEGPVLLAPMAGYTHLAFRVICRRMHAALVYTELASVDGLVRRQPTALAGLATSPEERPVAAHLYGGDPAVFGDAAAMVRDMGRFDLIDINAGCPVPKIMRRGGGAALAKNPDRLHEIVKAVRAAAPDLPVTVKTRIGPVEGVSLVRELVKAVEEGGADAIAFHARFTKDRHSGPAHWDQLSLAKSIARIPVIGNGGLTRPPEAAAMMRETGVDGVMIGRAAMGNPWIFEQCRRELDGVPWSTPTLADRREVLLEHVRRLVEQVGETSKLRKRNRHQPEEVAARHFRAHLVRYVAGFRHVAEFRRGLNDIRSVADIAASIDRLLARQSDPEPAAEPAPAPPA